MKRTPRTLKTRIKNLKALLKDAIMLGFSVSLIGNYQKELNDLQNKQKLENEQRNRQRNR